MGNYLTDTHCHLGMDAFEQDLEAVLQRAQEAQVMRILVPGIDIQSSRTAVELAQQHETLYCAVGVHPHHASQWQASSSETLRELASSPKCVAIGEIGLDYYRNYSPPAAQHRAFQAQLDLAAELALPIIVHNRQAEKDLMPILEDWSQHLGPDAKHRAGVLHAFSADLDLGLHAIEAGFFLGVAGPITYQNAQSVRTIFAQLPQDRLLIETDAPYMTPAPHRGKRNEPAYVRFVAKKLAELEETDLDHIARQTAANAAGLFGWHHGEDNNALL